MENKELLERLEQIEKDINKLDKEIADWFYEMRQNVKKIAENFRNNYL